MFMLQKCLRAHTAIAAQNAALEKAGIVQWLAWGPARGSARRHESFPLKDGILGCQCPFRLCSICWWGPSVAGLPQ